jgi:hypothetical protein
LFLFCLPTTRSEGIIAQNKQATAELTAEEKTERREIPKRDETTMMMI